MCIHFVKYRILLSAGVFLWSLISTEGRVFTTRPGTVNGLDDPSAISAKQIYNGHFRVNGQIAEMKVLAGSASVQDTIRLLEIAPEGIRKDLRYRLSKGTVVGSIGQGALEKRFLISSFGSAKACLVFVLNGENGLFTRSPSSIEWPRSLPVLDPLQQPQLVVEHLETDFLFASVILPQTRAERGLQICQDRMSALEWKVEPMTQIPVLQIVDSGFAVFQKKGKTCWVEAKNGKIPHQTIITLLCKTL